MEPPALNADPSHRKILQAGDDHRPRKSPMKTIEDLRIDTPRASPGLTARRITDILGVLDIRHVIIGGHAMAAYGVVRNTEAVDVIAFAVDRAAEAIAACHGHAAAERQPRAINTAVRDRNGTRIADVLNAHHAAAFRHALDGQIVVDGIPVPTRDDLIALKFEASTAPGRRRDKRLLDLSDLIHLIGACHPTDPARVAGIATLVDQDSCGDPERGAARWLRLHDDILNDRPITL
jgi:hypothetical protein